jgi:DNA-binding CsgD family transcriptional regulator
VDPTRLVGRNAELDVLTGLLAAAAAGQSVVALVSGDAGIGKTRLAAELAVTARGRGFTVLPGRCAELAGAIPYLPLADALRNAVAGPSAGELARAVAARPVLTQLLPDRPITPAVTSPPSDDTPGLARQRLFGAVIGMLTELAAASPVLLVLEDMHWADDSARDLVTFLSRVLRRERVAMLVSYRTDDLHRQHPLRPVLAELLRLPSVTPLRLGPLDSAAMAEHLTALSSRPLGAAELGQLIRRANGNPYYAQELLAAGDQGTGGPALPASLGELLVSRAERLPEAARQVVQAAAVTGCHVDDELVMLASGLAAPEYEKAMRQVVAHQLLVPDGPDGYAFRHALLREAVYADLLPGERARLHARLASVLSDERRLAEVPGTAAELAHHCLASQDLPGALAASVRAAKEAERQGAPGDAHRHYERAFTLWNQVAEPERVCGTNRNSLAFLSALRAADSGQADRAVDRLRELTSAMDGSDPALLCRASERLAYLLAEGGDGDGALAAAEAAVAALPADPPRWEVARALATHASVLLHLTRQATGDLGLARLRAGQAQAAARAAGALRVEADAMITLGLISEQSGRADEAIDLLERAYRQARGGELSARSRQHQVPAERCDCGACLLGAELRAAYHLARAKLDLGDPAAAAGPAHEGTRRARKAGLGMAPYGLDLQCLHYLVHYAGGAWDHAEQIAGDFAVRVTSAGEARLSAVALSVEVARGKTAQVANRARWLEPFFAADRSAECTARTELAEQALWQGDTQTALTHAEAAIRAAHAWEHGYGPLAARPAAVALGALADGAPRQAATTADGLLEIARMGAARRRPRESGGGAAGPGWVARAEAEWLRAVGRNDPAAWQAVVDAFGASSPYETARARWRLAEALAKADKHEAARREWRLAAQTAGDLGAVPLRAAVDDLGRRARLAPARQRSSEPAEQSREPLSRLTARELEVLRLLATGRGNKDIGATLFISAKTASLHVSNIMAKLGAASRIEAAAIAHQQGIATEPRPGPGLSGVDHQEQGVVLGF